MISVIVRTSDYRGDHSADVSIAQELQKEETVEHAAKRLLRDPTDVLEIRMVMTPQMPLHPQPQ